MLNYLSVKLTRPHEKPPLRVVFRSIFSILIWAILIPLLVQFLHHEVKPIFAKGLESGFLSKPFYKSGTYGIIRFDKRSSVPRPRESFISVSSKRPHLRAIVGAVHRRCHVTSGFYSEINVLGIAADANLVAANFSSAKNANESSCL